MSSHWRRTYGDIMNDRDPIFAAINWDRVSTAIHEELEKDNPVDGWTTQMLLNVDST